MNGTLLQGDALAALMLTRLLHRDLEDKVIQAARSMTENYAGGLPNSQVSRWRVLLRDALLRRDIPRVQKFCKDNSGKPGWKKMEKVRVKLFTSSPRLTEWIETILEEADALYAALGLEKTYQRALGSNTVKAADFNDEYRLRLLDAVLANLAKQNVKGGANG